MQRAVIITRYEQVLIKICIQRNGKGMTEEWTEGRGLMGLMGRG